MEQGLKNLSELAGLTFYVPDYQRGYRWGDEQIENLLEDLKAYVEQAGSDKTFFLEPIVVQKKNEGQFELIDGQQRLTTLFLLGHLLDALFSSHKPRQPIKYRLVYSESRENLEFLDQIAQEPLAEDWPGSDNCPDFYYGFSQLKARSA